MDGNRLDGTPNPRPEHSCVACERPDSAENLVACDKCSSWWHYTCAGVTDSVEHKEWTCSGCLPVPTIATSVRSLTSSRRANLQVKRLAEKQEIERKQLELEKKQLELQKKHTQEKFDLEESLAEEEDNRSVRSRVNEIESRKKQVSAWVDQHAPAKHLLVVPSSDPVAALTGVSQPTLSCNNNPANFQQTDNAVSFDPGMMSGLQLLQQQLEQCQQQSEPTLEQIKMLETQLQSFRIQLQERKQSTPLSHPTLTTSKGAIPKTNHFVDRNTCDRVPPTTTVPMMVPSEQYPISKPVPTEQPRISHARSNPPPVPVPIEQQRTHQARSSIQLASFSNEQSRSHNVSSSFFPHVTVSREQPLAHETPVNIRDTSASAPLPFEQPPNYPAHSNRAAAPANEVLHRPSPEQLAARQVMPRDLPEFTGDPEEWPIFFSSFSNSTAACGFSNVENLARLQRCLKGSALKSVRYYLLSPDSVPEVINTLRTLYGRPEIIINKLIQTVRETPAPKSERLDSLIDFGMSVRNLTQHLIAAGQQAHLVNPALLQELVEKLPANVKLQWAQHLSFIPHASLQNFSNFMSAIVESVSKVIVITGGEYSAKHEKSRIKDKSFVHAHVENSASGSAAKERAGQGKVCLFCGKAGHRLKDCTKFQHLPVDDRWKSIQSLKSVTAFAFLDDVFSATLAERSLVEELGVEGPNVPLCLKWTANMTRTEDESQIVSLEVSEIDRNNRFHLVNVRTVESLNLPSQTLCFEKVLEDHPHLKGLPVRSYENATPKLLIGLRNLQLAVPLKIKKGESGIIATKTRLGWCVYGSLNAKTTKQDYEELNYHVCECQAEEKLERLVKDYFNVEDCGVSNVEIVESTTDVRARQIMEGTTRRIGNRFETGLLWRTDYVELPDSFPMALRRLQCLERRMDKDLVLKENIHRQVQEYKDKGFAHLATADELADADPRRTWYLPLGVVCNPKKPEKVRLIWDAAAKVDGISLNSLLLSGPDLLVSLISVQFHFRQYPVAVSGDIKEMFHQTRVIKQDRSSQRFLFRNNTNVEPSIYIMDVLTFGASSSPASAQFVKNRNAEEFAGKFPRAASAIRSRHYVDDYLDSFETNEEAKKVSSEVKWVHAQGGFEIRNWSSNRKAVLDHLGQSPNQATKDLSLRSQSERVLGMLWHTEEDNVLLSAIFREEIAALIGTGTRPTKRQVLKCIMSLFDPLGLLACVLVHGKIMMQNIWRSGIKWDDFVDESVHESWTKWISLLDEVNEVRIPRCYFENASTELYRSLEAHVFVDASEAAYAAVVYFRTTNRYGTAKCALVSAKTKVAPLRYVSIPRLELMAAVLGTRLLVFVRSNHSIRINRVIYWSDSEVTLAWIRSEHRRYRPFVACRVGEILSSSNVNDWRYVPSKLNVSDEATKWGSGPCLSASGRWFNGPTFLQLPEEEWPMPKRSLATTDEELRACHLHQEVLILRTPIVYERFSNWNRLLHATAYVIRFGTIRNQKGTKCSTSLTHEELKAAEILLWKLIQSEVYPDELTILTKNKTVPICERLILEKSSPLRMLTPMLDDEGVLRVDSRISAAQGVAEDVKFPVILPRKHHVTNLIVDNFHRKLLHGNSETVVNEIRQRFYIAHLRTVVRDIEKRCQRCKVMRAKPSTPRMGPLPEARLSPGVRPFTYIGIDYFGPILVKVNRSAAKRWVCLITCLTIRAVHVEVAYDLSTKSCIACIRRFICRRGSPKEIYSDNGRNFTGAERILQDQIERIEQDAATTFTNTETKWFFIPPSCPHMGGSWERIVRSIKNAMKSIPQDDKLDDEGLQTVLIEAEGIVNSRPLTYLPLDSAEREALTPNHFILGSSSGVVQPITKLEDSANKVRRLC
ncbi:uncharacterized protein LOC129773952 [Toxorhynchites rutilus septentrionalis]|uniref:uncharacterized protein LOC129773952 n=1 Tax=Toxorhynchites rutilus septentrionalis TaxID=329112 RepID=UPI002479EA73|nr:uncharacterized protein LOC129773952 [Toxorhynchites rutilus septentrionalis]